MKDRIEAGLVRLLGPLAALLALASCNFFTTPFDLNIGKFNETGPQQPAAITLSDPQVFARETLINDRLREHRFLNQLLDESEAKNFRDTISTSALIRDVETLEAFRAAVDVNIDPAKGAGVRRQEELAEMNNEIELTQRRTELVKARKELQKARGEKMEDKPAEDKSTSTTSSKESGGSSTTSTGTAQPNQATASTAESQGTPRADKLLETLNNRIGELQNRLDTLGKTFGNRKVTVPVPDAERSRDAYRAELRQRLNAVNLDDLHDYNGNALYRLQFRATVMPGKHKDKFGIARITFDPPFLTSHDINELYRTWMNHLAFRLNVFAAGERCPKVASSVIRLEQAGLFDVGQITYMYDSKRYGSEKCRLYVPVPTGKGFQESVGTTEDRKVGTQSKDDTKDQKNEPELKLFTTKLKENSLDSIVLPMLEIIRSIADEPQNPATADARDAMLEILDRLIDKIRELKRSGNKRKLVEAPPQFRKFVAEAITEWQKRGIAAISTAKQRSEQFVGSDKTTHYWREQNRKKQATKDGDLTCEDSDPCIAVGEAYVYAASPLDKSQRLSTHAQTARSAELALSIAANLATQGTSVGANLGMVRRSAGIAEAFEHQPIVVGFAERRPVVGQEVRDIDPYYGSDYQAPQAGWVFGPEVRLDPEYSRLQLVHKFVAHEVSLDLSIPGWWPYVRATLETAWIGNLHNTGRAIRLEDEAGQGFRRNEFSVQLPLNVASLDGLTAIIARKTVGTFLPTISIHQVEPFFISACAKEVDLLVKGANVWRGTKAFLGGLEASSIAVLPDMEGIAARFDLDKLFATKNDALSGLGLEQGVRLVVWTRNGSDSLTLRLLGNRMVDQRSCIGRTAVSPATSLQRFEIVDIHPAQVCANSKVANFLVRGVFHKNQEATAIFGNSVLEKVQPLGLNEVFKLSFAGGPFGPAKSSVPLSMTNGREISSVPVQLVQCDKPEEQPKSSVLGTKIIAETKNKKLQFAVTLKDVEPSVVTDKLRIGVLPAGQIKGWIPSDAKPKEAPGFKNTYEATFSIDPTGVFQKTMELQVALLPDPADQGKVEVVKGTVIYYPTKGDAQVKVTNLAALTQKEEDVTFILPAFYKQAYPDLVNSKVKALVVGQPGIGLIVDANFSKPDDRQVKGKIKLKDAAAEKAWKELKEDATIDFILDGVNAPEISPVVIKRP